MQLDQSPAYVLRQLMVDLILGSHPDEGTPVLDWNIYVSQSPGTGDNVITVFDTTGIIDNRVQTNGEVDEHYGIMIQVRAEGHTVGYAKANEIQNTLDVYLYREPVYLDTGEIYEVHAVSRKGTINTLGKEQGTDRNLFTLNYLVALKQLS